MTTTKECETCGGQGEVMDEDGDDIICDDCDGAGEVEVEND